MSAPKSISIRAMLAPGRALEAGRSWEVVELVEGQPRRLAQIVECLWDDDAGVASRAADVLERVTRTRPRQAQKWKEPLLGLMAETALKKVRWNLALVVPRLKLTAPECRRVAAILHGYLDDASSIVKTTALHGLADLTRQDPAQLPEVMDLLRVTGRSGTAAMRARSRILLKAFESGRKPQLHDAPHMFD